MMNLNNIKAIYTQNCGIIAKPEDYEMTWEAIFKDNSKIKMFGNQENYHTKNNFEIVKRNKENLNYAIWIGSQDKSLSLGVVMNYVKPIFMVNNSLYSPVLKSYYSGHNFNPELFIRNYLTLEDSGGLSVKEKSMAYFAGFSYKFDNKKYKLYISWNGNQFKIDGFSSYEKIGEYIL